MSTGSRTTSRCRVARPAVRRWVTAVVGVLMLAVLTNTTTAHDGDRWPPHGSPRNGDAGRGGPGPGRLIAHRSRARYEYDCGYAAGLSRGGQAGYDDAFHGRRFRPHPHAGERWRSPHAQRGFVRGYADAYDRGYQKGRWQRGAHRRWHRHGHRWRDRSVSIRWHF